jgi:hypothetical protein
LVPAAGASSSANLKIARLLLVVHCGVKKPVKILSFLRLCIELTSGNTTTGPLAFFTASAKLSPLSLLSGSPPLDSKAPISPTRRHEVILAGEEEPVEEMGRRKVGL